VLLKRCTSEITSFIKALHEHSNLLDLEISDNVTDRLVFQELARLLSRPASRVYRLQLTDRPANRMSRRPIIYNDCITILSSSLVVSKSIKVLKINCRDISSAVWKLFSGVLCSPICLLERLTLEEADLDDNAFTVLGYSLLENKSLAYLKIGLGSTSRVTSAGWGGLLRCLRNPTSTLLELDVSRCRIVDAGATEIADALANNSTLKKLDMQYNRQITAAGWVSFFNRLIHLSCSLEELILHCNIINNQGAAKLVKQSSTSMI
jgi:Ran GTPase-activating protein (RanGAP) involved in mRNA processing and transport